MRDDELQILGAEEQQKIRRRWQRTFVIGCAAVVAVVALSALWLAISNGKSGKGLSAKPYGPTIIPELQETVDALLNDELAQIDGLQGQAIVMEVAMAGAEHRFDHRFCPCENFAYQQEQGALAMTASLLAALEKGEVKLSDTMDVGDGVWELGDGVYMKDHNWHGGGYGRLTLGRALEVSSDIAICKAVVKAFGNDAQGFLESLDKMSYGQPDSIEGIDGLRQTIYSSPKDSDWADRRMLWHAVGYERKAAPIQMLTFYNAIANGGRMVKPTLTVKDSAEIINGQIASTTNIALMQQALADVVNQGVGMKAASELVGISGMAGTSLVGSVYEGDACVNEYQVSFCGYFPAEAPRYSIVVSMNKLGLPASGGGMAGPVVSAIAEWMVAHGL